MREEIFYSNEKEWLELRSKDLTSTDISSLFGLSPYQSKFELWQRKKNNIQTEFKENERMKWGTRLESAIARGIGEDLDLPVKPFKSYMRISPQRLGSSFDFVIGKEDETILEIKNVDSLQFKNNWTIEDGIVTEAPAHIELQIQHQLLVSGKKNAIIGALVGGNSLTLLKRDLDTNITKRIEEEAAKFWDSIEKNIPPEINFIEDAKFIQSMFQNVSTGKEIENNDEHLLRVVEKYKTAGSEISKLTEIKEAAKAEILTIIGDAEKVKGLGFSISAGMVKEKTVSYTSKAYRNFRITTKKES